MKHNAEIGSGCGWQGRADGNRLLPFGDQACVLIEVFLGAEWTQAVIAADDRDDGAILPFMVAICGGCNGRGTVKSSKAARGARYMYRLSVTSLPLDTGRYALLAFGESVTAIRDRAQMFELIQALAATCVREYPVDRPPQLRFLARLVDEELAP